MNKGGLFRMDKSLVKGIFIEENKHRFLCTVNIGGQQELCHTSSSSKLSHFISLNGREVLLTKNSGKNNRTKYTLFAVKTEIGYALLNLEYINKLLFQEFNKGKNLHVGLSDIYPEKKINDNLKVDFFIDGESQILIEAKGILTEDQSSKFPAMRVKRAEKQLLEFEKLLKEGISVYYYIVLMNSTINTIELDVDNKEFLQPFMRCIKKGMKLFVYKTLWKEDFALEREYEVETKLRNLLISKLDLERL